MVSWLLWHFNNTQLCAERLGVCRENILSTAGLCCGDEAEWIRAFMLFPPNSDRSVPECHSRNRDSDLATHCPILGELWPQFPVLSGQPVAANVVSRRSSSLPRLQAHIFVIPVGYFFDLLLPFHGLCLVSSFSSLHTIKANLSWADVQVTCATPYNYLLNAPS